jgi:hypothetical protein
VVRGERRRIPQEEALVVMEQKLTDLGARHGDSLASGRVDVRLRGILLRDYRVALGDATGTR